MKISQPNLIRHATVETNLTALFCLVDDFYAGVTPPTPEEEQLLANIPFDGEAMRAFLGVEQWDSPEELSSAIARPTTHGELHGGQRCP